MFCMRTLRTIQNCVSRPISISISIAAVPQAVSTPNVPGSETTIAIKLCWCRLLPEHVEIYVYWLRYCVASCNRYLMLINHQTDGATRVFVLFNSNHQKAPRIDALIIMERWPYIFP